MWCGRSRVKYVVCPGNVYSKTDDQMHYVGPAQLMRLYGVAADECVIYEPAPWWPRSYYLYEAEKTAELIRLYPRADGNYRLPTKSQQGC